MTGNRRFFVCLPLLLILFLAGCPEPQIVDVTPGSMSQFGHQPIEIRVKDLTLASANPLSVRVGGLPALNVRYDGSIIRCLPQGSPTAGPADVEVTYGLLNAKISAPGAIAFTPTAFPQFAKIYNFGPSLSAGITNMGWEPQGQIRSVPAIVADQIGTYFPQRMVLEEGVPPIGAPNHVDLMFVGDGVRECYVPALKQTYVPAPGELCTPLIWDLGNIPVGPLIGSVFGNILAGILSGDGIVSGLFQNPRMPVQNWAVPGAQMVDYTYGTRIGFNYFQWMIHEPTSPLFNPFCLGEPAIKKIVDQKPDVVIGFDWFFDSVLFSHPPKHDLFHQLLFSMLVLSTGNYYNMQVCPPGQNDGGWGIPLIKTDGSGTRTFQPYESATEQCQPGNKCTDLGYDLAEIIDLLLQDPDSFFEGISKPKRDIVVDYLRPGYFLADIIPPEADKNGNGYLDIDFDDPENMEVTPELIAAILSAAPNPQDRPKAIVLATMPWPALSPSGQGGVPGGQDDQFAEVVNEGVKGLYEIFEQAFALAGLPNNIILMDVFELTREVIEGNRPELTHLLDGDPSTMDVWYEYDPGPPLKRRLLAHGGAFSLDHLHMSETMNAAIALEIVDHMNERFGTGIPLPDLSAAWIADPYRYSNYDPSIQCAYLGYNCP